jgi:hypothetical protein
LEEAVREQIGGIFVETSDPEDQLLMLKDVEKEWTEEGLVIKSRENATVTIFRSVV